MKCNRGGPGFDSPRLQTTIWFEVFLLISITRSTDIHRISLDRGSYSTPIILTLLRLASLSS